MVDGSGWKRNNGLTGVADRTPRRYGNPVTLVIAAAVPAAVLLGLSLVGVSLGVSVIGMGMLIGVASFTAGLLLGFLFGIPRTAGSDQAAGDTATAARYSVNTNLEQISDWLTKILVGVGLIQFGKLGVAGDGLVRTIGAAFAAGPVGQVAAGSLLTVSLISGFLFGYVATRTVLGHMFVQFDPHSIDSVVEDHANKLEYQDSRAFRAIIDQLDEDRPVVEFTLLKDALENASRPSRAYALVQAETQREKYWRDGDSKAKVGRTIPVFRALAEISQDNHRYWAGLGLALKDSNPANLPEALNAMDMAVTTRGSVSTEGKELYELVRAVVRIRMLEGAPPSEETRTLIERDVAVACTNHNIRRRIKASQQTNDPDLQDREHILVVPYLPIKPG
jgi:hypothetical protein